MSRIDYIINVTLFWSDKCKKTFFKYCNGVRITDIRTYIVPLTDRAYFINYLPAIKISRNPARTDLKLFSSIPVKTDYFANYFSPTVLTSGIDPAIRNVDKISSFKKALLAVIRPIPAAVYNINDPVGLKLLTRLRVNLSHLNEHKFRHNFQDTLNPLCSCSLEPESITHYLFHCLFYNDQRKTLLDSLCEIDESISNLSEANKIILYGNSNIYSTDLNTKIMICTICYIKTSERFDIVLF